MGKLAKWYDSAILERIRISAKSGSEDQAQNRLQSGTCPNQVNSFFDF